VTESSLVEFSEVSCKRKKLGLIHLNNPKALNSLSLEMLKAIHEKLEIWAKDPEIAAVMIHSDFPKAFCAGGEVKELAKKIIENPETQFPEEFFKWEYKTDYFVHSYPKPVLAWLHGITMGGGIGLTNGATHRVVTPSTVMAMPEISIGLFPDVGGGYFLSRLPESMGVFLGWTGARFRAADAIHLKLADFYLADEKKSEILNSLRDLEWKETIHENKALLTSLLGKFQEPRPESHLKNLENSIAAKFRDVDKFTAQAALAHWNPADPWLQDALSTFKKGSPLSLHIIYDHIERCQKLSLKEIFVREWSLAVRLSKHGDFCEGVRAVLIDKDQSPQWKYKKFVCVAEMDVGGFLLPWHGYKEIERFFSD
jgi:enoyl-CoA hydratase/carnithine racemase